MARPVANSVPNFNRNSNTDPTLIKPLTYWLGNSSELLHFFKNDIDLCSSNRSKGWDQKNDRSQTDGLPAPSSTSSVVCRDALHILAETVDHCFYYLRSVMTGILQPWLMCLTYPGDLDLQVSELTVYTFLCFQVLIIIINVFLMSVCVCECLRLR
ncbi:unnamed protein product [Trichobilharzia regenti]|nr:unnamed protein product [Trichobilharzia regenti]